MTWIGRSCWRSARALLTGSQFFGKPVLSGVQIERIGQDDAVERLIGALGAAPPMECFLDMNGRDVIGEQDDLVGVKLSVVFPREIGLPDQRGLDQPDEKDAGAGERVEDMNALVAQASPELRRTT